MADESEDKQARADSKTGSKWPGYCKTLIIKDTKGTLKELVFPKALDLDRPKRDRTTFSSRQLHRLEEEFQNNQYIVGKDRTSLAKALGLTETQVKVWFQNRRTKMKKEMDKKDESSESLAESKAAQNVLKLLSYQTASTFPGLPVHDPVDTPSVPANSDLSSPIPEKLQHIEDKEKGPKDSISSTYSGDVTRETTLNYSGRPSCEILQDYQVRPCEVLPSYNVRPQFESLHNVSGKSSCYFDYSQLFPASDSRPYWIHATSTDPSLHLPGDASLQSAPQPYWSNHRLRSLEIPSSANLIKAGYGHFSLFDHNSGRNNEVLGGYKHDQSHERIHYNNHAGPFVTPYSGFAGHRPADYCRPMPDPAYPVPNRTEISTWQQSIHDIPAPAWDAHHPTGYPIAGRTNQLSVDVSGYGCRTSPPPVLVAINFTNHISSGAAVNPRQVCTSVGSTNQPSNNP